MLLRLVDTRRAAELLRRHGAAAALAGLAIVGFAALAAIGTTDRWSDETRVERAADTVARGTLDRDRRILDQLATAGRTLADEPVQQLLDRIPSVMPEIRAAALYDSTGMLLLRGAGGMEPALLTSLGAAAAKQAVAHPGAHPGAELLVTPPVRDGDSAVLVGLARPWLGGDGKIGGLALLAVDRSTAEATVRPPQGAWPLVAISVIGVAGVLSLLALLIGRLDAAERNIAARTEVERELREKLAATAATADRTDESSRAKSRFFAQATHELRTPLHAILGFSQAIRHEMFGPVANPRYLEYAGLIQDAGSHLLSLINDLLDNSRIEAGKMEMSPIRMSAAALARSALDLVELLATAGDIVLATSGLAACPDLYVDPRAMKQVLVNLLSNAIKYTLPGGRIDLRFAARDDGGVAIEVADTGIGMSAEDLRIAFEPFGRADALAVRRQQGTGLGLSLARALVRLHGGDLSLASRLGAGTTATVTLPASAAFGGIAVPAPKTDVEAKPAHAA